MYDLNIKKPKFILSAIRNNGSHLTNYYILFLFVMILKFVLLERSQKQHLNQPLQQQPKKLYRCEVCSLSFDSSELPGSYSKDHIQQPTSTTKVKVILISKIHL